MNYEKFNDAMCRLRQAEEDFNKAIQDIQTGFNEYEKDIKEKEERQVDSQARIDEAYNKGLEDARNAVLQLYKNDNWHEIFGSYYNYNILENHSMAEIIEKINQLKAEKEKQAKEQDFHIGDEVKHEHGRKGIITNINDNDNGKTLWITYKSANGFGFDYCWIPKDTSEKTGRHFDSIPFDYQQEEENK